ncbi:MAG: hypothetical protein Q7S14_02610, partial [bacterium]|nr:hypothetical protein [bacterium]
MISSNDLRPVAQMEGAGNMLVNLVKVGAVSTAIIVIGGGVVVLVNAATGVVIAAGVSIGALATAVGFLRHQMTKLDNAFGGDSGTALQIGGGREKHGAPNRTGISTSTAIDNHAVTHSNNTDNRRAQTAEHRNGGLNIFGKHTNETNGSKVIHNHEASKWPTAVAAIFIFSVLAMFAASGQSSKTE